MTDEMQLVAYEHAAVHCTTWLVLACRSNSNTVPTCSPNPVENNKHVADLHKGIADKCKCIASHLQVEPVRGEGNVAGLAEGNVCHLTETPIVALLCAYFQACIAAGKSYSCKP